MVTIKISSLKTARERIKNYLKNNPGIPFIMGFLVLFFWCVFLLANGYSILANKATEYAYYLLVIGVILQFISFVKKGRVKQEEH